MKILAFDTSTEMCSVALYNHGELLQRKQHQPQQQANLLLPECQAILDDAGIKKSQLDVIAFCNGPGSFTGLRVATAAAQGIATAHDIPVVPISTLLTLAYGEYRRTQCCDIAACLDARMQEVYFAVYRFADDAYQVLTQDSVLSPESVTLPEQTMSVFFAGNGWGIYKEKFTFDITLNSSGDAAYQWPEAENLALLAVKQYQEGNILPADQALPVYIRDNVAAKKK